MKNIKFILMILCLILLFSCNTTTIPTLQSVTVVDMPEKVEIGKFDDAKIKLELLYSDGKINTIDLTKDLIPEEHQHYLNEEGTHNFNFSYNGVNVDLTITMYIVKYKITFINVLNEVVKETYYIPGGEIEYPTDEEMFVEGYEFLQTYDQNLTNIYSDLIVKGNYKNLHEHTYIEETTVEPTCTAQGYTIYRCECMDSYRDNYTDELGHNYVNDLCTICNEFYDYNILNYRLNNDGTYSVTGVKDINIINVIIPEFYNGVLVTSIRNFAFAGCEKIKTVAIPNSITSIGDNAFAGCSRLTSIEIPNSVTNIGSSAFRACSGLSSIYIPNSVTSIGELVFSECTNLESINVDEDNLYYKSIDGNLYSKDETILIQYALGKNDTNFVIPNGVSIIGRFALEGCINLINIEIPNSVTIIKDFAFAGCRSLTTIEIPNSVTSIETNAFAYCISLKSAVISDSLTTIEDHIFVGCSSLETIKIPNNVTNIEPNAFANCSSLIDVEIPNSVISIESSAFAYCSSLTSIEIPSSVINIEDFAFAGCSSLEIINVDDNNLYYKSIAGNLYSKDDKVLIQYALGKKDNNFVILNSVTTIGTAAFAYCSSLVTIEIPNSVTSIGDGAFAYCSSLTSIEIPNSVTSIGEAAFGECINLVSIKISENVSILETNLFYNCINLTTITIPNSVTSIGESAFQNCSSLVTIEIPDSVTIIGDHAFKDCSSLTIYCYSILKPAGWSDCWNSSLRPVVWVNR
ncbi:MAG: leucine-rich repeat domain-containing protein [Bacilli bacterium]|nr:leucine-rich repeat domain-containing protein [Bacilli bacterium]